MRLFALEASRALGEQVAASLGVPLAPHEEREFEDGEHKARPLESVRGADVYVLHSLYGEPGRSAHDKLCELLFFVGALRDAGAARITAVTPYLCYQRKDRRSQPRDPVTTRYVATLLEAVGVDRVVALDVHNPAAFDNAFRCPTVSLEARPLLLRHLRDRLGDGDPVVVSPDVGGIKRVLRFAEGLQALLGRPVPVAFLEKRRTADGISGGALVGEVEGHVAVIVDDMIATGATVGRAAAALRRAGAAAVVAAATHGLFVEGADGVVAELDGTVVTDTIPPFRLADHGKLVVLETAPLLAAALDRLHRRGSLEGLADP